MIDTDTSTEAVEEKALWLHAQGLRPEADRRATAAERDCLAAEGTKMREALEKIANRNPNAVGGGRRAVEYDAMRREARAALAGDTP